MSSISISTGPGANIWYQKIFCCPMMTQRHMPTGSEKTISNIPHEARKTPTRQGSGVRLIYHCSEVAESTSCFYRKWVCLCFFGKIPESNGWKPHFPYWSCHILVVEVYFFWPKYVFSSSGPGGNGCKIQATLKHQPHVRPHRDQRTEGKETILGLSDLWGVFVPRCL